MAAGIVHEDPAHRFGGCGEEVRPVFKLETLRASEPKIGFIHQRGRLQRVARTLRSHFVGRDRPQFCKNQIIELIEGNAIAPAAFFRSRVSSLMERY